MIETDFRINYSHAKTHNLCEWADYHEMLDVRTEMRLDAQKDAEKKNKAKPHMGLF